MIYSYNVLLSSTVLQKSFTMLSLVYCAKTFLIFRVQGVVLLYFLLYNISCHEFVLSLTFVGVTWSA